MDELRVLSPTAILGYGFPAASLEAGMDRQPHVIAVDAGSTDAGPYFLGMRAGEDIGKLGEFAKAMEADLRPLLRAALSANIPLIIGSAGGAGGNFHLMGLTFLIQRIAKEDGLRFPMAAIQAEIDPEIVKKKLEQGKVAPLGPVPELTERDVDRAVRIVAQMGVEPYLRALELGFSVIVAGRSSDVSMFAALPIREGFDYGLSLHLGKILECGAIAAEPGSGSDVLLGTIRRDHFLVEPMNPDRRCTIRSVAAHSLYESADPWRIHEPGGVVDLSAVSFTQEDQRTVRISGSRFVRDLVYRIKLEGAELVGYRTICIAGIRDPSVIHHLDEILLAVRKAAAAQFTDLNHDSYRLQFRVYGRDGVMGLYEPNPVPCHEVGLLIEVVAPTQEQATSICLFVRAFILHYGFPGRTSTAGNVAFPISPQEIPVGAVHRFSIYHLMEVEDGLEQFPLQVIEV